ncbi:MAG: dihydrolipoamide acetyltransferase family protein [Chloroflexota bacterium]|nr:dihydrolipoamide acetyltransferase family protein [Chloroflexota bacterium]
MPTNVIMPQLGESVVEGTLTRWLKREGDTVKAFEPLLEVSTDKVDTEVPAPADGVLTQILVQPGTTVAKGTVLAVIGAQTSSPVPTRQEQPHPPTPAPLRSVGERAVETSALHMETFHVTPVVARMAAENALDLAQIVGTGRGGRVTKKDVEAYLAEPSSKTGMARHAFTQTVGAVEPPPWEIPVGGGLFKSAEERAAAFEPPPSEARADMARHAPTPEPITANTPPLRLHPVEAIPASTRGELIPLSPMRRQIAEHMVLSKRTSPHVTTVFEIDMTAVTAHRQRHKADYAAQSINLTLTAYVVAAVADALHAVPMLNARWTDDGIIVNRAVNIGIAVAIPDGLIVPVIKNANELNLLGVARAVNDLAARARDKKLKPDEVKDGTFTITNHGVSGSLFATPIINQPQVGILGVGVIEKRVKVLTDENGNDSIAIRPCCYIALTFDHRVVDGATGDGFVGTVKQTLEGWR